MHTIIKQVDDRNKMANNFVIEDGTIKLSFLLNEFWCCCFFHSDNSVYTRRQLKSYADNVVKRNISDINEKEICSGFGLQVL